MRDLAMTRLIKFAAASALGLAVAGCGGGQPHVLSPANNPSVYSLHQPVVEHTNFVLDVATDADGLSSGEQARLADWFDSIDLAYGDRLTIDDAGYQSEGVRRDVARVAAARGLLIDDASAPVTEGDPARGTVRVIASRSTASVPNCPTWGDTGMNSPLRTGTNYGCATNSNLAAMIANPDDLIRGREASGEGAVVVAGRAVRTYRESTPSGRQGLPATSTTGR
jgi:pilus assembly protein CpaD